MLSRYSLFTFLFFCSYWSGAMGAGNTNPEPEWVNLFDGKSLNGWHQVNGSALYEVKDGMIVGTTVDGSPNSFIFTDREYGDFILELEFKVDEGLNSGIQIRSHSNKEYRDGIVHGYQIEIDPAEETLYAKFPPNWRASGDVVPANSEPRRWTAGIYDEKRRGWLCDLTHNEAARQAFKPDEWNQLRIEAIGDGIRTWLNGVLAATLADPMTPTGFIGLQVHSVKTPEPMNVRWKNIRLKDLGANDSQPEPALPYTGNWQAVDQGFAAKLYSTGAGEYQALLLKNFDLPGKPLAVLAGKSNGDNSQADLSLAGDGWTAIVNSDRFKIAREGTEVELRRVNRFSPTLNAPPPAGSVVLFDGSNLDAWSRQKAKEWLTPDGPASNWKIVPGRRLEVVPGSGSIITNKTFKDFKLHAEFRMLGEQTNGGIYLLSRYEINIKDSYLLADGAPCGAPGNISEPELSGQLINAAAPPMQWQTLDIEFRAPRFDAQGVNKTEDARITVALNGTTLYKDFAPKTIKGAAKRLGEAASGPIMLQEHGTAYQFRNIWLVEQQN